VSRLPALTGKRLALALNKLGFVTMRVRGSHHLLRHPDGRSTIVPVHGRETIGRGLLAKILRDCEISRDELRRVF